VKRYIWQELVHIAQQEKVHTIRSDFILKTLHQSNLQKTTLIFSYICAVGQLTVFLQLKGFEIIKNIYLEPEQWTIENGYLTPSMKLKRPAIKKKYQQIIEKLYKEAPLEESKL
jgi:long-subunit acyl-CoA synthetase (AMP-forming)